MEINANEEFIKSEEQGNFVSTMSDVEKNDIKTNHLYYTGTQNATKNIFLKKETQNTFDQSMHTIERCFGTINSHFADDIKEFKIKEEFDVAEENVFVADGLDHSYGYELHRIKKENVESSNCELTSINDKFQNEIVDMIKVIEDNDSDHKLYNLHGCILKHNDKDEIIKLENELNTHILSVHENIQCFSCLECDYVYNKQEDLKRHVFSHERERPYKCSQCHCSYYDNTGLTRHVIAIHEKLKPYKCSTCSFSFSQKAHLSQHILTVHQKLKPFKCSYCSYDTGKKCNLKKHVSKYHEKDNCLNPQTVVKPFKCSLCECSYIDSTGLSRHFIAKHQKHKPFKCSICSNGFNQKSHLSQHILTVHQKLKPFQCTHCELGYGKKSNLTNHIAKCHPNTNSLLSKQLNFFRALKCSHCDSIFTEKGELIEHTLNFHQMHKPYKCYYCDYESVKVGNISTHVLQNHPVEKNIYMESETMSNL